MSKINTQQTDFNTSIKAKTAEIEQKIKEEEAKLINILKQNNQAFFLIKFFF